MSKRKIGLRIKKLEQEISPNEPESYALEWADGRGPWATITHSSNNR
ncbi:MAG: hypothetical protein KAV87_48180 [Desulfobacteraceae bacterium]|nr:hypothetical protein [Desulfobacteraceae bacterium]